MNWDKTLIHCSSLSKITTDPRNKSDKDAGNLSETAKSHLIELYALNKYNFKKDISNKYTDKGNYCEPEGLEMISQFTGLNVEKNELDPFENEYFIGTPDSIVISRKIIFDNKASFDWFTFLSNIDGELDNTYWCQMNGYLDLLGWNTGYIAYTLIDTPEFIRNAEKYALLRKMDVISEDNPDFIRAWQKKEAQMIYSNTPLEERILLFEVKKDEEYLEKARQKVIKSRIFLQNFSEKHKNFNKSFNF
jgi:hypothetical protein